MCRTWWANKLVGEVSWEDNMRRLKPFALIFAAVALFGFQKTDPWRPTDLVDPASAAAKLSVEAAGPMSPAGALAMAVSLTGGSVHPLELPFKAPPPFAPHATRVPA